MSTAFDLLREAREKRNLSIVDVAEATMISADFLRAIDQGRLDVLPEPYIRAFMREYAGVVGLDPAALMQKFDRDKQAGVPPAPGAPAPSPEAPAPALSPPETQMPAEADSQTSAERKTMRYARTAVVLVVLAVIGVILWNILGREAPLTPERPFQEVVRENERRAAPADSAQKPGSTDPTPARKLPAVTAPDSLTLDARALDSVWVRLAIDNGSPRERFFKPGDAARWRAHEQFLFFTIGNPGAFSLRLNGRPLTLPGKPGFPLQRLTVRTEGIVPADSMHR